MKPSINFSKLSKSMKRLSSIHLIKQYKCYFGRLNLICQRKPRLYRKKFFVLKKKTKLIETFNGGGKFAALGFGVM